MARKQVLPRGAEPAAKGGAAGAEAKIKKRRLNTDLRRLREARKMQRQSHHRFVINRTQFRRLVVEVMREHRSPEDKKDLRIAASMLVPLQDLVEQDMHRMFLAARYAAVDVGGRRSVSVKDVNLAEVISFRPELVHGGAHLAGWEDSEVGVKLAAQSDNPEARGPAKPKKAKKAKAGPAAEGAEAPAAPGGAEAAPAGEAEAEEEEDEEDEEEEDAEGEDAEDGDFRAEEEEPEEADAA